MKVTFTCLIPVECATQPHVANAPRAELPSNVADLGAQDSLCVVALELIKYHTARVHIEIVCLNTIVICYPAARE